MTTVPNHAVGTPLPACPIAITQELIDAYAALSGDFNPIHVDLRVAAASAFGGTIAHGCIPMEPLFQAVQRWLGTDRLPDGATMDLRYRAPSRPGDEIRMRGELAAIEPGPDGDVAVIRAVCVNQRGEVVIDGECRVPLDVDGGLA